MIGIGYWFEEIERMIMEEEVEKVNVEITSLKKECFGFLINVCKKLILINKDLTLGKFDVVDKKISELIVSV